MFTNIASFGMGVVSARRGGDWPVRVVKKRLEVVTVYCFG